MTTLAFDSFRSSQQAGRTGVLAYVRVSDPSQAERKNSIEQQQRLIEEHFAGKLGLPILGWYIDEGKSAYKDDEHRTQFWEMVERAKTDPRVGIIAVDEESRFFRNKYKTATVKGELLEHGVRCQTVKRDADPRTIAGLWMESIEETMAHAHSMANRDYVLRGMSGNVHARDPKSGWAFKNGGQAPYGWVNKRLDFGRDEKGRPIGRTIWELDPPRAEVRRQILLWRKEGWTYEQIRNELNGKGTPAPRGGLWSTSTITGICREDMVWTAAGYTVWNKHYRKQAPKGEKFKPTEEWVVEANAHPAIITEDEAREILALNRRRREEYDSGVRKSEASPYLLKGDNRDGVPLFICGHCGKRVIGQNWKNAGRRYLCSTKVYKGSRYCPTQPIDGETLDARVVEILASRFTERYMRDLIDAANEAILAEQRAAGPDPQDTRKARMKEIDQKLDRIRKSIMAGFDPEVWADEVKELQAEKKALEEAPEQEPEATPRYSLIPPEKAEELVQQLQAQLKSPKTAQRRRFVASLVHQVTLISHERAVYLELHPDPLDLEAPTLYAYRDYRDKVVPPRGRVVIAVESGGSSRRS